MSALYLGDMASRCVARGCKLGIVENSVCTAAPHQQCGDAAVSETFGWKLCCSMHCTAPVRTRYNTNHDNPVRIASQLSQLSRRGLASQQSSSSPQTIHCHSSQNSCTASRPTVQPLWLLLLSAVALDAPVDVHVAHAQRRVLAGSNLFVIEDHPAAVLQPRRATKIPWIAITIIKAHAWQSGSTETAQDSRCNLHSKQKDGTC